MITETYDQTSARNWNELTPNRFAHKIMQAEHRHREVIESIDKMVETLGEDCQADVQRDSYAGAYLSLISVCMLHPDDHRAKGETGSSEFHMSLQVYTVFEFVIIQCTNVFFSDQASLSCVFHGILYIFLNGSHRFL